MINQGKRSVRKARGETRGAPSARNSRDATYHEYDVLMSERILPSYQEWKKFQLGPFTEEYWDKGLMFLFHPYTRHENNLTREQTRQLQGQDVSVYGNTPEYQPTMVTMRSWLQTFVGLTEGWHTRTFTPIGPKERVETVPSKINMT